MLIEVVVGCDEKRRHRCGVCSLNTILSVVGFRNVVLPKLLRQSSPCCDVLCSSTNRYSHCFCLITERISFRINVHRTWPLISELGLISARRKNREEKNFGTTKNWAIQGPGDQHLYTSSIIRHPAGNSTSKNCKTPKSFFFWSFLFLTSNERQRWFAVGFAPKQSQSASGYLSKVIVVLNLGVLYEEVMLSSQNFKEC